MSTIGPNRFLTVAWLERRSKRQRQLVGGVVLAYFVWRLLRSVAALILDRWWFESVTEAPVWSTKFWAQAQLFVGAGLLTAVVLGGSVFIVLRLAPRRNDRLHPFWQRYHDRMGPGHRWLLIAIAVFFTYRIGTAASGQWQSWLLFRNSSDLGETVPGLGTDLGNHLFRLPFMTVTSSFVRQLLLFAGAISLFGHLAAGSIRLPGKVRSSHAAMAHLAALLAAFTAGQALHYAFVQRLSLGTNRVGAFDGPGFTELQVVKPMLFVAALAALATGFAGVHFGRTRSWKPFAVSGIALAVIHVGGLVVAPALAERYVVAPAEAARQLDSIDHNLTATRRAYGLEQVEVQQLTVADGAGPSGTAAELSALDRVPLFDQFQMATALQVVAGTPGSRITDVDLDRYEIDGTRRPVLIAARSASRADLPEQGWVQEHLVYTHGDGVVVAPADTTDVDGRPDVVPFAAQLEPDRPELYFGEGLTGWYALVDTKRAEQNGARFDGTTGIPLGSLFRRTVLAFATGEPQPVLSAELTSDTQLLYRRDLRERIHALAPFLSLDSDPYPIVSDGRVVWVLDAYTTSSTYPYAQFASSAGVPGESELAGRSFNYARGSVKVVVDALTGDTHLYRTAISGANDPILDAWDRIFPGLLEPISELSPDLAAHLRYPSDLFVIQTNLLGRYHVADAETLFNGSQRWTVSAGAVRTVGDTAVIAAPTVNLFWPINDLTDQTGAGDAWVGVRPYSPGSSASSSSSREELVGIALGDHDNPERLVLLELTPTSTRHLSNPQVAQSAIDADSEVARAITLLNANGSKVQFGPMTPLIVDGGLMWTRPIIVSGTAASAAPRLWDVTVVSNGLVGVGPTPAGALAAAVAR